MSEREESGVSTHTSHVQHVTRVVTRHRTRWGASRERRRWMRSVRGRDAYVSRRGRFQWECSHIDYEPPTTDHEQGDAPDRVSRLQAAVDRAHSALIGSQYVDGPTEREAYRTAVEALGEVATQHRGQEAR